MCLPQGGSPAKPSVVQALPPYLLENIFLFAVTSETECLDFDQQRLTPSREKRHLEDLPSMLSAKSTLRNVSQVCQNWRATVLECQRLWSTIQILETHMHTPRGMRKTLEKTKDMIKMSGDLPLTMTASIGYGYTPSMGVNSILPEATFQSFLNAASAVRHRWEKICFTSFNEAGTPVSDRSFRLNNFPLLKELILRFPIFDSMNKDYEDHMVIDLSSCTKLQTLKLDGYFRLISDGTTLKELRHVEIIRHLNIPSFHSGLCTMPMVATLIKIAPNLVSLELDLLPEYAFEFSFGWNPIKLSHLEELTLNTVDTMRDVLGQLSDLLDLLHLPSLLSLEVEIVEELDIVALLVRSSCQLKSFTGLGTRYLNRARTGTLGDDVATHRLLASWLSFMPELENLTLDEVEIPLAFINRLALYDFLKVPGSEEESESDGQGHSTEKPTCQADAYSAEEDQWTSASIINSDDESSSSSWDDCESSSDEGDSDASYDDVDLHDDEEDIDFDVEKVELCPDLKALRLYKCSLNQDYQSVGTAFIGMLLTRVRGIPGTRGKIEHLEAVSSEMADVAQNELLQEWVRKYNLQLLITE